MTTEIFIKVKGSTVPSQGVIVLSLQAPTPASTGRQATPRWRPRYHVENSWSCYHTHTKIYEYFLERFFVLLSSIKKMSMAVTFLCLDLQFRQIPNSLTYTNLVRLSLIKQSLQCDLNNRIRRGSRVPATRTRWQRPGYSFRHLACSTA